MNRQVGPSILLSVAIVCFFAVALYQHDPPQTRDGRSRSRSADAIARSGSAPLREPKRSTSTRADTVERVHSASVRTEREPQPVPSAVPSALRPSLASATRPPGPSVHRRAAYPMGSEQATKDEPIEVARRPASPFTIVEADESLEDVARRIYGSGTHVDALWRANRDTLTRKDSPLATGMVLRTPMIR
jgi:nucleoid-associated protein YgaU